MAIDHVTGAIGVGEIESEEKEVRLGIKLLDCFQGSACQMVLGPRSEVCRPLAE